MTADGKNVRQLTHLRGGDLNAFANGWSPDGKKILYHLSGTLPNGRHADQLFITDAEGKNNRQLTHLPSGSSPSDHAKSQCAPSPRRQRSTV